MQEVTPQDHSVPATTKQLTPAPVFRPQKRRKVARRHNDFPHEDDLVHCPEPTKTPAGADVDEAEQNGNVIAAVAEDSESRHQDSASSVLRQRRQARARRGGIGFSTTRATSNDTGAADWSQETALVPANSEPEPVAKALDTARNRFAPQTGTVAESNDTHMTAYIDAHISRMRTQASTTSSQYPNTISSSNPSRPQPQPPTKQPAALGQIQEINLGPSVSARNASMTEAAYARLNGAEQDKPAYPSQANSTSAKDIGPNPQPFRSQRDGTARPPRRKHQRPESDLARDAAVDAVFRENQLGLYSSTFNDPSNPTAQTTPNNGHGEGAEAADKAKYEDETADEAFAARFQAEYMEAMADQRRAMPPPPPTTIAKGPGGKAQESELARGPKLGGSRSARAAMHAAEKERERAKRRT